MTGIMLVVLCGGLAFLASNQVKKGETTNATTATSVSACPNEQAARQTTVQGTILGDASQGNSQDGDSEETVELVQDDLEDESGEDQADTDSDKDSSDEDSSDLESSEEDGDTDDDTDLQEDPIATKPSERETYAGIGDRLNTLYSSLSCVATQLNDNVLRPLYDAIPSPQQVPIPDVTQLTEALNNLSSRLDDLADAYSDTAPKLNDNVLRPVDQAPAPRPEQIPIPDATTTTEVMSQIYTILSDGASQIKADVLHPMYDAVTDSVQASEWLKHMYSTLFAGAPANSNKAPPVGSGSSSTNTQNDPSMLVRPGPMDSPGNANPKAALDPEKQRFLLGLDALAPMQQYQAAVNNSIQE